jgi:hypothetical protein
MNFFKKISKKAWTIIGVLGVAILVGLGIYGVTQTTTTSTATTTSAKSSTAASSMSYSDSFPTSAVVGDDSAKATADGTVDLSAMSTTGSGVKISDKTVTISKAGTYYITGTASDAQIVIDAADDAEVTIIMNGVSLTSSNGPAILEKNADKTTIETAKNSVNIVDGGAIDANATESAAIYAYHDLTIKGDGELAVNGDSRNGIKTKDDLKIKSGVLNVQAVDHALVGNDSVHITDGTVIATSGDDTVKSTQTDDEEKGLIEIKGGTITLSSTSGQALNAERTLDISGGTLNVTGSYEALQAYTINISGGDLTLTSSDDAINATGDYGTPSINISGGTISFMAGGDGLDSNGNLTISGGTIEAIINSSADNEAMDLDGTLSYSGGTVLYGGTNTGQTVDGQYVYLSNGVTAGDKITVKDSSGNVVAEITAKQTTSGGVALANTAIKSGSTYTVSVNGTESTITAGTGASTGMGGMGGGPQR